MFGFKRPHKPTIKCLYASEEYHVFTTDGGKTIEVFAQGNMEQLSLYGDSAAYIYGVVFSASLLLDSPSETARHAAVRLANYAIRLQFQRARGEELDYPTPEEAEAERLVLELRAQARA